MIFKFVVKSIDGMIADSLEIDYSPTRALVDFKKEIMEKISSKKLSDETIINKIFLLIFGEDGKLLTEIKIDKIV